MYNRRLLTSRHLFTTWSILFFFYWQLHHRPQLVQSVFDDIEITKF